MSSKRHHNKDKKKQQERIPDIFKDLWGFDFIEDIGFCKIKGEMPKIRITVARENENKITLIKDLLQKYEFPFSNLKIVISGDKKESETKPGITGPGPSFASVANKFGSKGNGKPNTGPKKPPPFKCV
ncbi:MAG: hypothetical protein Q7R75_00295 [bacterium]|nr:hypothetical protein [bacterium]